MNEVLYWWPAAAAFGRLVPKTKFYEHATVLRPGAWEVRRGGPAGHLGLQAGAVDSPARRATRMCRRSRCSRSTPRARLSATMSWPRSDKAVQTQVIFEITGRRTASRRPG